MRLLAIACVTWAALAAPASATVLPQGFQESTALSGLMEPTSIDFSPDGRVFVTEKGGLIKVFDDLSDTTPTTFANLRTKVFNGWDRGLLGLALDPDFPTDPHVYVAYTHDAAIGQPAPRWGQPGENWDDCPDPPGFSTDGCVVSGLISKLRADGNTMTGTEQVLVEDWCQQYASHSIGDLAFGPDGALYAGGGDGASYTFVDYGQAGTPKNPCGDPPTGVGGTQTAPTAEGGALRSQDARTPSDPMGLNGSIIRVDPDTGAGLPGNPMSGSSDPNARRIVAHGFRNPFRFTVRPGTEEIWVGDVGWGGFEEIDRIGDPTDTAADNFGWPCYEGVGRHDAYDAANLNLCENLYLAGGGAVSTPYFSYAHSAALQGCAAGGSALTGITFYPQNGPFPAKYDGGLFFADYARGCIWAMPAGAGGLPDTSQVEGFGINAATPVDLEVGPDGNLYYLDVAGGAVQRVSYFVENEPPVAVAAANPTNGPAPLAVQFDGTGSSDADPGDAITYAWDLDGDGQFDDSTAASPSHTYTTPGTYTASLRVTDGDGASDTDSVTISAGNTAPNASIDSPANLSLWEVGETISFAGSATDPQQGTLPASAFSWQLDLEHCPSNCHTHPLQSYANTKTGSFTAPDHEHPSHLRLRLTVTDSGGLQDSESVRLDPRTVSLRMESDPAGLQLALNGQTAATPFSRTVIKGSRNSLAAGTPQALGGHNYFFDGWSDAGARSHDIVADSDATYTATYVRENRPPVAVADASPKAGPAPLTVQFSAGGSSDPDGDQLDYAWDLDDDGQHDDSTQAQPTQTYDRGGSYDASLRVTDSGGSSATDSVTVNVANSPPDATITAPAQGFPWSVGETIGFTGRATDAEDGLLPASAFSWQLEMGHCLATCHRHALPGYMGMSEGSFIAPEHEYPTELELRLTVTDSGGLQDSDEVSLDPRAVTVRLVSDPNHLRLRLNGEAAQAPLADTVIMGSHNTLAAPGSQRKDGRRYLFKRWSDGGAQEHDLTADSSHTYEAVYRPRRAGDKTKRGK